MDTKQPQNHLIEGKIYLSTNYHWFFYRTSEDAHRMRKWALFHSDAFGEAPIYDRVPLQYYNKDGLTVLETAIPENERECRTIARLVVTGTKALPANEPFMFLKHKEPTARERIKDKFMIQVRPSERKPWYTCQILFQDKVGWFIWKEWLGIHAINN